MKKKTFLRNKHHQVTLYIYFSVSKTFLELKQDKKSAAEMRSPGAKKETGTGGIKKSIFTLHLTEMFLSEDIEMGDLDQDNTDQDEEDSDPELKDIRESMLI